MEELVDLIATDASASDVSDKIKDALMAKASARIDALRPEIASSVFDAEAPEEEEASVKTRRLKYYHHWKQIRRRSVFESTIQTTMTTRKHFGTGGF